MGTYSAISGQILTIDLLEDSRDNGWTISGGKAIHSGCNAGSIELKTDEYQVGVPNIFEYEVEDYVSNYVQLRVGSNMGVTQTSNGIKKETFTPQVNDKVTFYSNGELSLKYYRTYPVQGEGESNGVTFGFYEKENKWGGNFSFLPENLIRFVNGFYTFKDGELWKHNTNDTRNNFYGEQYTSKITFYVNLSPSEVKNFYSMRQISNKVWTAPNKGDILIYASNGKPNGQESRLRKGRFKQLNGDFFADFMRDMQDERFMTEEQALQKGALLQGNVMRITIENDDIVEVRLQSVDITVSPQNYTY